MSTATARVPSVSPDSSPMAASVSAGFLTTPAPRTRPAGDSHSTSGAPPVRGLCIKGAEDRPLASALSCLVGEIVLPEYKHLNAEFQRIARRDKKAFLSDQCKEIEENNRMGKTRDLFKKN